MNGQHTPGPWAWFGNAGNKEIYLATTHSGRRYVMGFQRWGFRGAQPTFQPADRGLVPAERLLKFQVGNPDVRGTAEAKDDDTVYRLDIKDIDCADARLIAAAPDLLEVAEDSIDILTVAIEEWNLTHTEEADEVFTDLRRRFIAAIAKAVAA